MTAGQPHVVIREATGDDLTAVVEVGRRTWPATYGPIAGEDYVAMGLAKWWTQEATIPAIRAGRVTVADVDGAVAAMASVGAHDGVLNLWKLYVLPEYQDRGLGNRLMRAVIAKAVEDGYRQIELSYLDGNDHAGSFYRHFGFVETAREESGHGIPDSIWMRLELSQTGQDPTPEDGQV